MDNENNRYDYSEDAETYDLSVKEYGSYGHDVLFGMSFEYVKPGQNVLDIGIGTGLGSYNFALSGLKVFGLDSSQKMLNICKTKKFTESLALYDIIKDVIPHDDNSFDNIVCSGVLHFVGDLKDFFKEVKRVAKPGATFSFTFAPHENRESFLRENTDWGVPIYRHSLPYITELLNENDFDIVKEQRLLLKGADKINYNMLFSAVIAKKRTV